MRWEQDERGRGVADAGAMAPGVHELATATGIEDWVAEEPETHLLPHIRRALDELGLDLLSAETEDAVFVLRVSWTDSGPAQGREALFRVVGSFAELATSVRVREANRVFEVVTGMLEGDSQFMPHGHMVRIELVPAV